MRRRGPEAEGEGSGGRKGSRRRSWGGGNPRERREREEVKEKGDAALGKGGRALGEFWNRAGKGRAEGQGKGDSVVRRDEAAAFRVRVRWLLRNGRGVGSDVPEPGSALGMRLRS